VVKVKSCYANGILVEGTPKSMRLHIIHRRLRFFALLLLIPVLSGIFLVFGQNQAQAANPNLINFQGKVVNGSGAANPSTNVTDGSYTFRFCLYSTASPATPCTAGANNDAVWRESKSLTVTNGVFQTELGDTTTMIDVSAYTNLYLGINFNGDAAGEMTPRIHLDSVPYALNSDKLGGLTSSGFIQNTTSPQSTSNFNISGTGVAGTALQAPILQTGSGDLALQPASGIVALNRASTNNELRVYENAVSPSNYASITATSSDATFKSNIGITKIGNGTGAITLNAGSGAAVNITGHTASVWQTDAGSLTIQGGSTLSLLSTTSSAASLDSGSTGAVSIGTGANDKAISIGSTQTGTTVSITGGTTANTAVSISTSGAGGITIDSGTIGNVKIGAGANAKAVTVGNTTAGSTLILQGGNTANTAITLSTNGAGGLTIDSGTTGNINIANGAGNAKIATIGNSTNGTQINQTAGAATNSLTNSGNIVQTNTNSATAFGVKNSAGITLLGVDTNTNSPNNLVTNPSFETATMWTAKNGSGTSATSQVSSTVYNGSNAMQVATSSTATNAGASFTVTLTLNTTYTLSLYVKASATNFSTFQMGYTNTGGDNNCFTSDQTVTLSGWTRLTCNFTVTTTAGTAIYVKQSDAVGRTYLLDAALLETDTNASGYYGDGKITLQGDIASPVIIQATSNSANALLVQNAAGTNIFGVDTTDTNLVNNPGVEISTVNWAGKSTGTAPIISRDSSNSYLGYAALKVVTGTTAQDGVKFTFPNNTTLLASTQYSMSFYAKISAASIATFAYGRSDTGVAAGELTTGCSSTATLNTAWTRFTCSFTTGATMGASGNPYIFMSQGTGTSSITYWVDALSLEPGATASPYGAGSVFLNGVINSPVNFQNKTDSTTAFQVENAANSVTLFSIDTSNNRITLGTGASTSATVLVLGNKTDSGDPTTCTPGAIYFNSSGSADTVFRACRNTKNMQSAAVTTAWQNLIAGVDVQDFTATSTWTKPQGVSTVMVIACGGGGSGGGGRGAAAGSARQGGTGGGGGTYVERIMTATDAGASQTVTVGAQTTGGAANSNGNVGNPSSFGTFVKAAGGGAGAGGPAAAAATAGGTGAGLITNGVLGTTASANGADTPSGYTTTAPAAGTAWTGGGVTTGGVGMQAQYGGGGGGGTPLALGAGANGGDSVIGGGGGGGGGSVTAASPGTASTGGAGGGTGTYSNGGAANANAAGSAGNSSHCGTGGGGGLAVNNATGNVGGAGGTAGGGGGGGGGGTSTGGVGGVGGRGEVWVFSW
jgi:hypothetical protein